MCTAAGRTTGVLLRDGTCLMLVRCRGTADVLPRDGTCTCSTLVRRLRERRSYKTERKWSCLESACCDCSCILLSRSRQPVGRTQTRSAGIRGVPLYAVMTADITSVCPLCVRGRTGRQGRRDDGRRLERMHAVKIKYMMSAII